MTCRFNVHFSGKPELTSCPLDSQSPVILILILTGRAKTLAFETQTFLQARCPSCRPTNSSKTLKASYPCWQILHQVQRTFGVRASLVPAAGVKSSLARNWSGRRTRWPLTFSRRTCASAGLDVAITGRFWCSRSSRKVSVSSVGIQAKTYNLYTMWMMR